MKIQPKIYMTAAEQALVQHIHFSRLAISWRDFGEPIANLSALEQQRIARMNAAEARKYYDIFRVFRTSKNETEKDDG